VNETKERKHEFEDGYAEMMRSRKHYFDSIGFWLGFLIIAINQLLDVTLVTIQGQVETVTCTLANFTDSALLLLCCYAAVGAGSRLLGRKRSTHHGLSLPKAEIRSGS
jgi:hypothetical protein